MKRTQKVDTFTRWQCPSSDEESEKKGEVFNTGEFADFIVDNDEENEDNIRECPILRRRRRKRHHSRLELDQEDLDLIREYAEQSGEKRSRLVKIEDSDEEVHGGRHSDEIDLNPLYD